MKAAETSASIATADCTPLTVVSRSSTTAEMDTFMNDVSITNTNIAAARKIPVYRLLPDSFEPILGAYALLTSRKQAAAVGTVGGEVVFEQLVDEDLGCASYLIGDEA